MTSAQPPEHRGGPSTAPPAGTAAPSPPVRRIATPGWLDVRLILGVLLVVAAVLAGALVLARADRTTPVLALTRELAAGSRVDAADLRIVRVRLPDAGSASYVSERADAIGKQLNRPLGKGELIPASALREVPPQTTLSVPFGEGAAPRLHPGDRIQVWLSAKACAPVVVLPDAVVQDVAQAQSARLGVRGGQDVVLSLDPPLAERMISALGRDGATVRAGVLSGPAPTTPARLPALDGCPADGGQDSGS